MASYDEIDYSLRCNKAIERYMLCDLARRLFRIAHLPAYRYVGFGATEFRDFIVVHRGIGIEDMHSIEKDDHEAERFEFNKPYGCIKMHFGKAADLVPQLIQDRASIIWLDFDDSLNPEASRAIRAAVSVIQPRSLLMISLNCHFETPRGKESSAERADAMRAWVAEMGKRIDGEVLRGNVNPDLWKGWNASKTLRGLVEHCIAESLLKRNIGLADAEVVGLHQVAYFEYQDGVRMLTLCYFAIETSDPGSLQQCRFDELSFVKFESEAYRIKAPAITLRERKMAESKLPDLDKASAASKRSASVVQNLSRLYRYWPLYAEAEI